MPGYQKKNKEEYDQKTANLTPEEQEMRKENLEARDHFGTNDCRKLCAAVCLRAILDYKRMTKKLEQYHEYVDFRNMTTKNARFKTKVPKKTREHIEHLQKDIKECEEFFQSDMFTACVGLDGSLDEIKAKIKKIPRQYNVLLERRCV